MDKEIIRATFMGYFDESQTQEVKDWIAKCPKSEHPLTTDISPPTCPPFMGVQMPVPLINLPPIRIEVRFPKMKGRKIGRAINKKDVYTDVDFSSPIKMLRENFPDRCPGCGVPTDGNLLFHAVGELKSTPISAKNGYLCDCGWLVKFNK